MRWINEMSSLQGLCKACIAVEIESLLCKPNNTS